MKTTYRWRHSVPAYPTYEWAQASPQTGAVVVAIKKGFEAAEVVGVAKMLYISAANMIKLAIADGTDKVCWGASHDAGVIGDIIEVCAAGSICKGFSGLTPGAIYYLSQSAAGEITSTEPASGEVFVVGVAVSATVLLFNPYHK